MGKGQGTEKVQGLAFRTSVHREPSNPEWSTQDAIPGEFWRYVMDLTYGGNSRSADQFIASAWPAQRSDKDQRMREFLTQLKKSPYSADIQAINGSSQNSG